MIMTVQEFSQLTPEQQQEYLKQLEDKSNQSGGTINILKRSERLFNDQPEYFIEIDSKINSEQNDKY